MDNFAALITHYFLNFFHSIGMDSVVRLFGSDAYYCAIGIDKLSSMKSLVMCHYVLWLGYIILITFLIVAIWLVRKNRDKVS